MSKWILNGRSSLEMVPTYEALELLRLALNERLDLMDNGRSVDGVGRMMSPFDYLRRIASKIYDLASRGCTSSGSRQFQYSNAQLWMCDLKNGDLRGMGGNYRDFVLKKYGLNYVGTLNCNFVLHPLNDVIWKFYHWINDIHLDFYWEPYPYKKNYYPIYYNQRDYRNNNWTEWVSNDYNLLNYDGVEKYGIYNASSRIYQLWNLHGTGARGIVAPVENKIGCMMKINKVVGDFPFAEGDYRYCPCNSRGEAQPTYGLELPGPPEDEYPVITGPVDDNYFQVKHVVVVRDFADKLLYYDPPQE